MASVATEHAGIVAIFGVIGGRRRKTLLLDRRQIARYSFSCKAHSSRPPGNLACELRINHDTIASH
ncbi:hypothetical protein RRSWK_05429 [Rhodopirellula sp. SWK7]|nr:hypothetical protein RRSWK_05429 [Rhodopirellula sp. SWK7]